MNLKKLLLTGLSLSLVLTTLSCTKSEENDDKSNEDSEFYVSDGTDYGFESYNYDLSKLITLGKYEGLEYTKTEPQEITEENISDGIKAKLSAVDAGLYRSVEKGDTVNIDYEGKKDGVAFQGGTATGASLTIGSNAFIDGFETGLIGHKSGETVTLNLTFPETYKNSPDLAGQDVVFTVKINSITPSSDNIPELTDKIASLVSDYSTADEYRAAVIAELKENAVLIAEQTMQNEVLTKLSDGATVIKYPKAEYEKYYNDVYNYYINYYTYYATNYYQIELKDYVKNYLNMSESEFYAKIKESADTYSKDTVKKEMSLLLIARNNDITLTDDDYNNSIDYYTKLYKFNSSEELLKNNDEKTIRLWSLIDKTLDFVFDKAVSVEPTPTTAETTESTTSATE